MTGFQPKPWRRGGHWRNKGGTRPPTAPNSFVFAYIFTENHPRRALAPLTGLPHIPTGNPGSSTGGVKILIPDISNLFLIGKKGFPKMTSYLISFLTVNMKLLNTKRLNTLNTGADPGFPIGRGVQPLLGLGLGEGR